MFSEKSNIRDCVFGKMPKTCKIIQHNPVYICDRLEIKLFNCMDISDVNKCIDLYSVWYVYVYSIFEKANRLALAQKYKILTDNENLIVWCSYDDEYKFKNNITYGEYILNIEKTMFLKDIVHFVVLKLFV